MHVCLPVWMYVQCPLRSLELRSSAKSYMLTTAELFLQPTAMVLFWVLWVKPGPWNAKHILLYRALQSQPLKLLVISFYDKNYSYISHSTSSRHHWEIYFLDLYRAPDIKTDPEAINTQQEILTQQETLWETPHWPLLGTHRGPAGQIHRWSILPA